MFRSLARSDNQEGAMVRTGQLAGGASQRGGHGGGRPGFGIEVDFVALDRLQMSDHPHAHPDAR